MLIRTYHSDNAADRLRWLAYIDNGGRDYLPVRFSGATEEEARANAQAEWDKREAERKEKAANKAKASAARARKTGTTSHGDADFRDPLDWEDEDGAMPAPLSGEAA